MSPVGAILAATVALATPAGSPLVGTWASPGDLSAARIGPCVRDSGELCAVVVRETVAKGELPTLGQVILHGLRPDGPGRWKGVYIMGRQTLPATVRLRRPGVAEMTVCRWPLCRTVAYRRVDS